MQQWEYRVININEDYRSARIFQFYDSHGVLEGFEGPIHYAEDKVFQMYAKYLNCLGQASWEVVSANGLHHCILKRSTK